jgi:chemotaxis signal transduction protein
MKRNIGSPSFKVINHESEIIRGRWVFHGGKTANIFVDVKNRFQRRKHESWVKLRDRVINVIDMPDIFYEKHRQNKSYCLNIQNEQNDLWMGFFFNLLL